MGLFWPPLKLVVNVHALQWGLDSSPSHDIQSLFWFYPTPREFRSGMLARLFTRSKGREGMGDSHEVWTLVSSYLSFGYCITTWEAIHVSVHFTVRKLFPDDHLLSYWRQSADRDASRNDLNAVLHNFSARTVLVSTCFWKRAFYVVCVLHTNLRSLSWVQQFNFNEFKGFAGTAKKVFLSSFLFSSPFWFLMSDSNINNHRRERSVSSLHAVGGRGSRFVTPPQHVASLGMSCNSTVANWCVF